EPDPDRVAAEPGSRPDPVLVAPSARARAEGNPRAVRRHGRGQRPRRGFAGSPTGTLAAGFTTPAPSLAGTGGGGATVADALPVRFAGAAPLAGAVVALLVVLAGAMAAFGGGRIADNVLAAAGSSCPEGLDRVPAPGGGP